ncbi:hypothetical protein [Desertivirga xinjiangensis]|uniref:hypothetical protein n=1 Tax=Desertivirga xinjiangensis TaxID=539206 RepID=UPI00210BB7D2|nr:hypothetical protein [Pedobacter xinjiangensis]
MSSFYKLFIECDEQRKKMIDRLLGVSNGDPDIGWSLIVEEDSPDFPHALDAFISLISKNLAELREINVSVDEISFWYMYEYEQQCNMEFAPHITKGIGDLGIVFCVSCWEK